jgi:acyl carrier protein
MSASIAEQIKRLIVEDLDVRTPAGFHDKTPLFKGGVEMDSFAAVELLALIESHFGIELELADIRPEHFTDVATLGSLVARYVRP